MAVGDLKLSSANRVLSDVPQLKDVLTPDNVTAALALLVLVNMTVWLLVFGMSFPVLIVQLSLVAVRWSLEGVFNADLLRIDNLSTSRPQ